MFNSDRCRIVPEEHRAHAGGNALTPSISHPGRNDNEGELVAAADWAGEAPWKQRFEKRDGQIN